MGAIRVPTSQLHLTKRLLQQFVPCSMQGLTLGIIFQPGGGSGNSGGSAAVRTLRVFRGTAQVGLRVGAGLRIKPAPPSSSTLKSKPANTQVGSLVATDKQLATPSTIHYASILR